MKKLTPVASEQNISNAKQIERTEEVVSKLSEMIDELVTESSDFQEYEMAALGLGNELVRRALKKN